MLVMFIEYHDRYMKDWWLRYVVGIVDMTCKLLFIVKRSMSRNS